MNREVTQQEKEIISYLGVKRYKEIKKVTPEESKIFSSFEIKLKGSYLVEGKRENLLKFKNYYLCLCAWSRPAYCQHMFSEFVENSNRRDLDEDTLSNLERELMFLYCHKEPLGIGNTENWMEASVLSKVANRNRKGLLTVILTERELPLLQKSEELTYIDLVKPFRSIRTKTYLEKINTKGEESTSTSNNITPVF